MDTTKKTLLIDADILMFRFAFKHQKEVHWPNGAVTFVTQKTLAKIDIDQFIKDLLVKTHCVDYILCFTDKLNFRYSVLPSYKSNRANIIPPKLLGTLKKHMKNNHPWHTEPYLEADDYMGILGTRHPNKYVLTTNDKDFKSLPVTLFNWDKDEKPKKIEEQDADFNFHYQWLIGDSGDGYKGCYKIGDKKARKILGEREPAEWSAAVVETYADKCYSWEEILQQARMARILRSIDYNFKRKEIILWSPNC